MPITSTPSGNTVPVTSSDDVLAVLSKDLLPNVPAIVRDALVSMLVDVFLSYQDSADYAKNQSDPLTAVGIYLKGLAADRGIQASAIDTDDTLRAKIIGVPDLVTPTDIMSLVNTILAQYTTKLAKYFECPLDCTFVTTGWGLFVTNNRFSAFIGTNPTYQDRLYDNANNLSGITYGTVAYKCIQRDPLRARINADTNGRMFWINIPDLSGSDNQHLFTSDENGAGTVVSDFFVFNGSNAGGTEAAGTADAFLFSNRLIATDIYQSIATAVQFAKGQGIRWTLFVDPSM